MPSVKALFPLYSSLRRDCHDGFCLIGFGIEGINVAMTACLQPIVQQLTWQTALPSFVDFHLSATQVLPSRQRDELSNVAPVNR
jgi:hypothetical protein